ncbi:hypothetical protein [Clostridium sp. M14]|uniref:hypothetical protein n=1 Tax=Clostridium sp. M14 TaxID=2716311 RepID=UPI0013EEE1F2|nr:hypothetical protein [Clostridium sp. M14]MBZ9693297.1 hypothetical protein [Clostridium sp. M14]
MINREELKNKLNSYGYSKRFIDCVFNFVDNSNTYNSQNVLDILDTGGSGLLNIWMNRNLK